MRRAKLPNLWRGYTPRGRPSIALKDFELILHIWLRRNWFKSNLTKPMKSDLEYNVAMLSPLCSHWQTWLLCVAMEHSSDARNSLDNDMYQSILLTESVITDGKSFLRNNGFCPTAKEEKRNNKNWKTQNTWAIPNNTKTMLVQRCFGSTKAV